MLLDIKLTPRVSTPHIKKPNRLRKKSELGLGLLWLEMAQKQNDQLMTSPAGNLYPEGQDSQIGYPRKQD